MFRGIYQLGIDPGRKYLILLPILDVLGRFYYKTIDSDDIIGMGNSFYLVA
ncbi:MAG: hypothetical protein K0R48_96 [Gammaproteobacteria bacterium]|jgi:hypothetical protein|nr:hypothetical protein [Gammaproteobacteria bacterium]